MPVRWAITGGNFSNVNTWNDGATLGIPTTGDDVYANSFTVNMDVNATVISLNNSARARDIATPLMTSVNTPQGTAISSGDVNTTSAAWKAFNRIATNNADQRWQSSTNDTGWVGFQFNNGLSPRVINQYLIYGGTLANNPNTWTFQGSNDNVTWITLHTVTNSTIGANSTYSSPTLANTTAYEYYRINVTAVGTAGNPVIILELELYQPGTVALASGGSFNFNTAGVSVTCTSTSASLSAGATNLITVTATTGTVTLNAGGPIFAPSINNAILISHSGNCNFNVTAGSFNGTQTASIGSASCILKSSTGLITINGFINGVNNPPQSSSHTIRITSGDCIVNGVVTSALSVLAGGVYTIQHSAGNLTINGNVIGGGPATTGFARAVFSSGTSLSINGSVIGALQPAIETSSTTTITGAVIGGPFSAVISTSANTINVTGDVYASATANGISSTNASGVVNLTGNMYNGLGRNAIYCQNIFISNTATTLWRMDTGGGDYKFLYSADTTPNLPPITDVRNLVTYGPALSLTGTMVVPAASDTRKNVPVDNTVGTGELTSADIISGINASSDPLAVRLKNALTDVTAGNIISQYKDS